MPIRPHLLTTVLRSVTPPIRSKSTTSIQSNLRCQFGPPNPIVCIRSKRGYSATKYDVSSANLPKSLQPQFSQKYDQKKMRNKDAKTRKTVRRVWRGVLVDPSLGAKRALAPEMGCKRGQRPHDPVYGRSGRLGQFHFRAHLHVL